MLSPYDEADLIEGQALAVEAMRDVCKVRRRSDKPVTDADGVVAYPGIVVYPTPEDEAAGNPGRCSFKTGLTQANRPEAGLHGFTVEGNIFRVPVGTCLQPGDEVTVERAASNPGLVGVPYSLTEMSRGSYQTAERWNVEAVTA